MKISIAGCGWLGLPLAEHLLNQGHQVKGSTTTADKLALLERKGIKPYLLKLVPEPEPHATPLAEFLDADVLVINIPPARRHNDSDSFHAAQIQALVDHILPLSLRKVIFISSTSVYPSENRVVTEADPTLHQIDVHNAIVLAENVLRKTVPLDVTVLRAGGLMGYNRIPGKYFAGQKGLTNGEVPVNFVHRDDVIAIIEQVILQGKWNRVFNLVAPEHPLRKEIYPHTAKKFGFEVPEFAVPEQHPYKVVSSEKVCKELNYVFKYPDPLEFYYEMH